MSKPPFRRGDLVWHRPTRTTWTVASCYNGLVERQGVIGDPLRVGECRLIDRPTKAERKVLNT